MPLQLRSCQCLRHPRPSTQVHCIHRIEPVHMRACTDYIGLHHPKAWNNMSNNTCEEHDAPSTGNALKRDKMITKSTDVMKYYEAQNYYTNNSETILLCDRCACNWRINSQTTNVCHWRIHRKYHMKAPKLHKIIPVRKPWNICPV